MVKEKLMRVLGFIVFIALCVLCVAGFYLFAGKSCKAPLVGIVSGPQEPGVYYEGQLLPEFDSSATGNTSNRADPAWWDNYPNAVTHVPREFEVTVICDASEEPYFRLGAEVSFDAESAGPGDEWRTALPQAQRIKTTQSSGQNRGVVKVTLLREGRYILVDTARGSVQCLLQYP
ncbi:MAG: hypothetical protein V1826_02310 [bacterium]